MKIDENCCTVFQTCSKLITLVYVCVFSSEIAWRSLYYRSNSHAVVLLYFYIAMGPGLFIGQSPDLGFFFWFSILPWPVLGSGLEMILVASSCPKPSPYRATCIHFRPISMIPVQVLDQDLDLVLVLGGPLGGANGRAGRQAGTGGAKRPGPIARPAVLIDSWMWIQLVALKSAYWPWKGQKGQNQNFGIVTFTATIETHALTCHNNFPINNPLSYKFRPRRYFGRNTPSF